MAKLTSRSLQSLPERRSRPTTQTQQSPIRVAQKVDHKARINAQQPINNRQQVDEASSTSRSMFGKRAPTSRTRTARNDDQTSYANSLNITHTHTRHSVIAERPPKLCAIIPSKPFKPSNRGLKATRTSLRHVTQLAFRNAGGATSRNTSGRNRTILAESGPNSAEVEPNRVARNPQSWREIDQVRPRLVQKAPSLDRDGPSLARLRPNLGYLGKGGTMLILESTPNWVVPGPNLVDVNPNLRCSIEVACPFPDQIWSMLADGAPKLGQLGPSPGQVRSFQGSMSGRVWPMSGSMFGRARANFRRSWGKLARIRPNWSSSDEHQSKSAIGRCLSNVFEVGAHLARTRARSLAMSALFRPHSTWGSAGLRRCWPDLGRVGPTPPCIPRRCPSLAMERYLSNAAHPAPLLRGKPKLEVLGPPQVLPFPGTSKCSASPRTTLPDEADETRNSGRAELRPENPAMYGKPRCGFRDALLPHPARPSRAHMGGRCPCSGGSDLRGRVRLRC